MGVPTSEVGYTSATAGRGDREVHDGPVGVLGGRVHFFLFVKIYLQDVNIHTSVPDSTKLFLVNQFTCKTLAVRGGHGATSSGDGRYSSEKMAGSSYFLDWIGGASHFEGPACAWR
jgi:hypothetical protein